MTENSGTNTLLIGDLHFGIKNNNNSWLNIQKKFLDSHISNIIGDKENNIDRVIFLGDLTDIRYSIQQQVGVELKSSISYLLSKFRNVEFIFIAGNHDFYSPLEDMNTYNSYNTLFGEEYEKSHPNVKFITTDPYYDDHTGYLYLPWYWTENPDHFDELLYQYNFKNEISAIFCHTDLSVWPGPRITALKGTPVYSGHIHFITEDKENKLFNLGAALQLTFNDVNQDRYVYLLSNDSKEIIKKIKNDVTYKFIRIYHDDILNVNTDGDEMDKRFLSSYVQLCITPEEIKKIEYIDKIKEIKTKYGDISNIRVHIVLNQKIGETKDDPEQIVNYNYNIYDFIKTNIPDHLNEKLDIINKEILDE